MLLRDLFFQFKINVYYVWINILSITNNKNVNTEFHGIKVRHFGLNKLQHGIKMQFERNSVRFIYVYVGP